MTSKSEHHTSWKNIFSVLADNKDHISRLFMDDEMRMRTQFACLYLIFVIVSVVMTIMNVITDYHALGVATFVFALANLLNIFLAMNSHSSEVFSRILFVVEIYALFTFFIISGYPQGFSAIWIVLLPTGGMLLYRLKKGLIISLIQLGIIVFFLWTELGRSMLMYEYTDAFIMRFPVLYISFMAVGIFFEILRHRTHSELVKTRNEFEFMSNHDSLTGLYNRLGFNTGLSHKIDTVGEEGFAFAIIDLDHFKLVNDNYGHVCGDEVLKGTAKAIETTVGDRGRACRWGGEEFAVIIENADESEAICKEVLNSIKAQEYHFDDSIYKITASLGLVKAQGGDNYDSSTIITMADANLYTAKESGRDCMIVSEI